MRSDFRDGSRHGGGHDRKTDQLCAQVRLALEFALHGACEDPLFDDLVVVGVRPAPHAGRLEITFGWTAADGDLDRVLDRLETARARLTAAVADWIRRRKVPELVFAVEPAEPG